MKLPAQPKSALLSAIVGGVVAERCSPCIRFVKENARAAIVAREVFGNQSCCTPLKSRAYPLTAVTAVRYRYLSVYVYERQLAVSVVHDVSTNDVSCVQLSIANVPNDVTLGKYAVNIP